MMHSYPSKRPGSDRTSKIHEGSNIAKDILRYSAEPDWDASVIENHGSKQYRFEYSDGSVIIDLNDDTLWLGVEGSDGCLCTVAHPEKCCDTCKVILAKLYPGIPMENSHG